ncbi:hypothetical protein FRC12_024983 [Ceratobasidium sp. 428]|nr:hypothetical protein FRC12_024983 [Ceratobasidium sp. 428]
MTNNLGRGGSHKIPQLMNNAASRHPSTHPTSVPFQGPHPEDLSSTENNRYPTIERYQRPLPHDYSHSSSSPTETITKPEAAQLHSSWTVPSSTLASSTLEPGMMEANASEVNVKPWRWDRILLWAAAGCVLAFGVISES